MVAPVLLVRCVYGLTRAAVAFARRHRGLTITLLLTWAVASGGKGW
ncbi:MAG TPA: hypothetical protein VK611_25065 [Acidimicrobiales bacterium]|nr:hypothetical protein [Acidimicrobiales bacterium]